MKGESKQTWRGAKNKAASLAEGTTWGALINQNICKMHNDLQAVKQSASISVRLQQINKKSVCFIFLFLFQSVISLLLGAISSN